MALAWSCSIGGQPLPHTKTGGDMLTREENEMLTRVGPGTPCGELMRRYWHPIAATVQLEDNPVRKVRILGEDLVLFRDQSGNIGLIGPRCPHRAMHMAFGIPEEVGL